LILLDAGQHVPRRRTLAGAKQRNPGVRCAGRGEAGTLLLGAGTECENERDNRAGAEAEWDHLRHACPLPVGIREVAESEAD
jgi:hypothetical protein